MSKLLTPRRIVIVLALTLAVGCAVRNFYVSPGYSRAFSHVPDSVENTLAMKNLMAGRGFTIRIDGVDYKSRYQPWFSLLFVAPALAFSGGNVLCSWYGCFAAGVVALFAAFMIGRKIGGSFCGVLLAAVLGVFADFARYTNVAMTEVPHTMLLLFAAAAWIRLCEREETRAVDYLLFGVLCALAGALRSTALVLPAIALLPLLKRRPGRKTTLGALAAAWAPAAAVAIGLYLPYFSFQERFFVPVRALAILGGAAAAALAATSFFRRRRDTLLCIAAVAVAAAPWPDPHEEQLKHDGLRSAKIDLLIRMHDTLPENAVLLTIFQQGAAEYFFVGDSGRRIIPFFRCYEYAQMVTAKRRIPAPPGGFERMELAEANDYIAGHGGVRPYPWVYTEAPEKVDEMIRSGVPVYVSDYTLMIHKPARELAQRYELRPAGKSEVFGFYRLMPR